MIPRGLILALGFLTRLPMPKLVDSKEDELSSSAVWFPLVGMVIGLLLVAAAMIGSSNPWLAALLVLLVWIGVTGALHLDGASDLADALGVAHRDPERLLAVMKDPHTGSFGVVAIVITLLTKLVATASLVESADGALWTLLLIPAWARFGAIYWSHVLEPIAAGSGERFKRKLSEQMVWGWGAILFVTTGIMLSWVLALIAVAILLLWQGYLKWRLNGMTGDCLGAGIEFCECAMLLALGLL